jgi:surfeit locus 1 family protein
LSGANNLILVKAFNRNWWWKTLLILAGVVFLARLGFWQLDRLDQRRSFNETVAARWQQTPFDLMTEGLPEDLEELEYRRVAVDGEFDYGNQIVLKERPRDGAPGVILVTPLVLQDGRAVLVARGWVPQYLAAKENWPDLEEKTSSDIVGLIQESQLLPNGEVPPPPSEPQTEWFNLNIDAIRPQMPYELLPVFVLQLPEEGRSLADYPLREEPLALSEGNHFSYAIQWFMFAAILGVGYLILIQQQEARRERLANSEGSAEDTQIDGGAPDAPAQNGSDRDSESAAPITELPARQGHA